MIEAARATLAVDSATQTFAEQENKRYTDLAGTGYGSVQNAQQAQSRYASAQAAVARDTANLASALRAGRTAQGRDRPGCRGVRDAPPRSSIRPS